MFWTKKRFSKGNGVFTASRIEFYTFSTTCGAILGVTLIKDPVNYGSNTPFAIHVSFSTDTHAPSFLKKLASTSINPEDYNIYTDSNDCEAIYMKPKLLKTDYLTFLEQLAVYDLNFKMIKSEIYNIMNLECPFEKDHFCYSM